MLNFELEDQNVFQNTARHSGCEEETISSHNIIVFLTFSRTRFELFIYDLKLK